MNIVYKIELELYLNDYYCLFLNYFLISFSFYIKSTLLLIFSLESN